jgi:hypothetical protein
LALGGASKPRGKKAFFSKTSGVGLGLGPKVRGYLGPNDCGRKLAGDNQLMGQGLKAGPVGLSGTGRPKDAGCSKRATAGGGSGMLAGQSGCANFAKVGPGSSTGPARLEEAFRLGPLKDIWEFPIRLQRRVPLGQVCRKAHARSWG